MNQITNYLQFCTEFFQHLIKLATCTKLFSRPVITEQQHLTLLSIGNNIRKHSHVNSSL